MKESIRRFSTVFALAVFLIISAFSSVSGLIVVAHADGVPLPKPPSPEPYVESACSKISVGKCAAKDGCKWCSDTLRCVEEEADCAYTGEMVSGSNTF